MSQILRLPEWRWRKRSGRERTLCSAKIGHESKKPLETIEESQIREANMAVTCRDTGQDVASPRPCRCVLPKHPWWGAPPAEVPQSEG